MNACVRTRVYLMFVYSPHGTFSFQAILLAGAVYRRYEVSGPKFFRSVFVLFPVFVPL